jgi:hypothetical protein
MNFSFHLRVYHLSQCEGYFKFLWTTDTIGGPPQIFGQQNPGQNMDKEWTVQ